MTKPIVSRAGFPINSGPNIWNLNELFYIDDTDVGLGVFAKRQIAPGEEILDFSGPVIDFEETKRRGTRECMPIQIGIDRYMDTRAPGVFVNHSCNPNAGIRGDKYLVAIRTIPPGEEIRYDYSTTIEEHSFNMRCRCGMPGCRKWVGDFSQLPEIARQRYISLGVVMAYILELQASKSGRPRSGR